MSDTVTEAAPLIAFRLTSQQAQGQGAIVVANLQPVGNSAVKSVILSLAPELHDAFKFNQDYDVIITPRVATQETLPTAGVQVLTPPPSPALEETGTEAAKSDLPA